jgi:mono/diheme cytochrome c family protein
MTVRIGSPLFALLALIAGCEAGASSGAAAEARQIYGARCVTCHGATGDGDGPAAANRRPPPKRFSDPAWQRSISDPEIERIIRSGGAALGKSAAMPPNPDLAGRPEVVTALREHVRGFGRR